MAGIDSPPDQKLPLRSIIGLAYGSYVRHFGDVLRISVLWLLLIAVFKAAAGWMQAAWTAHVLADPSGLPNLPDPIEITALGGITSVAMVVAVVSIAVAWHRRLLLGEPPGSSGSNLVTGSFWRYVAVTIVLGVIGYLPMLVEWLALWMFGLIPAAGDKIAPQSPIFLVVFLAAFIVSVVVLLRLMLLLPANATGHVDLTVRGAWRSSRGNVWRLFWGVIVCMWPPYLLAALILVGTMLLPLEGGLYRFQSALASALSTCCWLIGWPIWIGFLSYAYRHLVPRA